MNITEQDLSYFSGDIKVLDTSLPMAETIEEIKSEMESPESPSDSGKGDTSSEENTSEKRDESDIEVITIEDSQPTCKEEEVKLEEISADIQELVRGVEEEEEEEEDRDSGTPSCEGEFSAPLLDNNGIVFPDTPCRGKRRRILFNSKAEAYEHKCNNSIPMLFQSQKEQMEYEEGSMHLTAEEVEISSEFYLTRHHHVKICLLKDRTLDLHERIIIVFKAGRFEIRIPAFGFFDEDMKKINSNLAFCERHRCNNREMMLSGGVVYGESFYNHIGYWTVFKMYACGIVREQIYFSSESWSALQNLAPVLGSCAQYYFNMILSGTADNKPVKIPSFRF